MRTGTPSSPWIEALFDARITGGDPWSLYCPDTVVTRAQMAVFLLKSKHGPTCSPADARELFTDVPISGPDANETLFSTASRALG